MDYDHDAVYERFLREIDQSLDDTSSASDFWQQRGRQIKQDAMNGNRSDFLRWPGLDAFSVPESWIPPNCFEELRRDREWSRRWFGLTRDTKLGAPKDFSLDLGTSPILVQHAFHLLRYERTTNRSILDCDVIFEIGGGYGSFCRLLKNAGFDGLHMIYDLPCVSAIQRLYLTLLGFSEISLSKFPGLRNDGFTLITDRDLDEAFEILASKKMRIGFVATWSLSEMPRAIRDRIFPRFHAICANYLIAFQPNWDGLDNARYFDDLTRARPDLAWHVTDMPRIIDPPSQYVFA